MDEALRARLTRVDTPTVCNAIELAQGGRGFQGFTRGTMLSSAPAAAPVVGHARTARIRGLEPPTEPAPTVKQRRLDYYRYMAAAPTSAVAVVEDLDFPDCVGAFWGEINTTIHKGFGLSGAVTNGVMRDLGDLAPDFPVIAGSIGPSHGWVHVVDVDRPVEIHGLTVAPGTLIHADRHGAVAVPDAIVPVLGAAIDRLMAAEALILGPAREPGFDIAAFETAWAAFEAARV